MKAPRDAQPAAFPANSEWSGPPLSVAVITLDEESNLPRCLASVAGLAAEIVVVDSHSRDRTREIAESFGARVLERDWPGHVEQKNVALAACTQPWVLSLDADEALDKPLRAAIETTLCGNPTADGYRVNRLTWYLGDWIRHAWYPEWRLRLVRREAARWTGTDPHDRLEVTGEIRQIEGHLLHYSYRNLSHHLEQTLKYGRISGEQVAAKGRRVSTLKLVFSPLGRFLRILVLKQGWRDGWRGVLVAGSSMIAGFAKYAFALERQRREADED